MSTNSKCGEGGRLHYALCRYGATGGVVDAIRRDPGGYPLCGLYLLGRAGTNCCPWSCSGKRSESRADVAPARTAPTEGAGGQPRRVPRCEAEQRETLTRPSRVAQPDGGPGGVFRIRRRSPVPPTTVLLGPREYLRPRGTDRARSSASPRPSGEGAMSGLGFVHEYRTIHSQVFLDGALVRLVECPAYAFRRLRERVALRVALQGPALRPPPGAFGALSHKQRQLVVVVPEPLGVVPLDHLDRCPAVGREPLQIRALR